MSVGQIWQTAAAVVLSLGGGGAIVVALSSWFGKVWANRILEKDRSKYASEIERLKADLDRATRLLQGEIEKTLFVTKTHFETEFKILREIWQRVSEVRGRMSRLRPTMDIVDVRRRPEDLLQERFESFVPALADLIEAVDHTSPFYPPRIYAELDGLIRIAQSERDDIRLSDYDGALSFDGRQRGKANFEQYLAGVERVSGLIREHLANLAVREH